MYSELAVPIKGIREMDLRYSNPADVPCRMYGNFISHGDNRTDGGHFEAKIFKPRSNVQIDLTPRVQASSQEPVTEKNG